VVAQDIRGLVGSDRFLVIVPEEGFPPVETGPKSVSIMSHSVGIKRALRGHIQKIGSANLLLIKPTFAFGSAYQDPHTGEKITVFLGTYLVPLGRARRSPATFFGQQNFSKLRHPTGNVAIFCRKNGL
jgi:hypothetical protein